jgi:hypothetical protein
MCVNFKALNSYTKPDMYPLPRIDASLSSLKGAQFISVFDMNKGFHQIRIKEEDIPKTAFVTHQGLYEYTHMPLGLRNAPACFQRAMDTLFAQELREGWLNVYIDDIIIFSTTWVEHLRHINIVCSRIIEFGFTISLKKCRFGYNKVHALGHVVSGLTLAVDDNRVAAIRDWPVPTNVKSLMVFLGFAGYHRKHIPNFALLAKPLTPLLKKDVRWSWTSACQHSFDALCGALLKSVTLYMPDFAKPFKLYIDASGEGLGGALYQNLDPHGEVPICFIS